MDFTLDSIEDKQKFHIESDKEYGKQRVNEVKYLMIQVCVWKARVGETLCYKNYKTGLFDYSKKKIINIELSVIGIKVETENEVYSFSSNINIEEDVK